MGKVGKHDFNQAGFAIAPSVKAACQDIVQNPVLSIHIPFGPSVKQDIAATTFITDVGKPFRHRAFLFRGEIYF